MCTHSQAQHALTISSALAMKYKSLPKKKIKNKTYEKKN